MNKANKKGERKFSQSQGIGSLLHKDMKRNWSLYLMILPVLAFYIVFMYKPMYGAIIAFKRFSPGLGILGSPWVGLENFKYFFSNPDFIRILGNTLKISLSLIIFGFPAPIILTLMFNELRNQKKSEKYYS